MKDKPAFLKLQLSQATSFVFKLYLWYIIRTIQLAGIYQKTSDKSAIWNGFYNSKKLYMHYILIHLWKHAFELQIMSSVPGSKYWLSHLMTVRRINEFIRLCHRLDLKVIWRQIWLTLRCMQHDLCDMNNCGYNKVLEKSSLFEIVTKSISNVTNII